MKKKTQKLVWILLIILFVINIFSNTVLASNVTVVNEIEESVGADDAMNTIWDVIGTGLDRNSGIIDNCT